MHIARYVWGAKSPYAKKCIRLAGLVWLVLVGFAWWNPNVGLANGHWTNREFALLVGIVLLVVAAQVIHLCDTRNSGFGLKHVYETDNRGSHRQDELSFAPSTMTAESIRAAMIAALLVAILTEREKYLPAAPDQPIALRGLVVGKIIAEPGAVFFCLVVGALAASIVMTMVALLCYEYICRYEWKENHSWPKDDLRRKAFDLGTGGFYCLMWALSIAPALLDYRLGFISTLFVFGVMWYYYFFPVPASHSDHDPERLGGGNRNDRVTAHPAAQMVPIGTENIKPGTEGGDRRAPKSFVRFGPDVRPTELHARRSI